MIFTEIWQKDRSESLRSAIDSAPGYTRKEKRHDGENTLCIVQHHGNCTGNCAVASGRACTGLRKKRRFTTAVMYHSARTGKHGQPVLGTGTINGMTKTKQRQCIPESNLPWRHYRRENIITDPAGEGKYP